MSQNLNVRRVCEGLEFNNDMGLSYFFVFTRAKTEVVMLQSSSPFDLITWKVVPILLIIVAF